MLFLSPFSFALVVLCILLLGLPPIPTPASSTNDSDRLALLHFKLQISADPVGALSSWNDSNHFCQWNGVQCSRGHPHRVTVLDLDSKNLEGTLSPHIANLSFLSVFYAGGNKLHGPIPHELGHLFRLQILSLYTNQFEGEIPTNLTHCANLRTINLGQNKLSGAVPIELSSLTKLTVLFLAKNNLIGNVPPFLGNLSSLTRLSLGENNLIGSIPGDLCRIQNVEYINLYNNKLIDTIPACIFNLSHIASFAVTHNQLEGTLPVDIGLTLPNLQDLLLGMNRFRGLIPLSLSNSSRLKNLALYDNQFVGHVPKDLGRLQFLELLELDSNKLGSQSGDDLDFITFLTNCSNLHELSVSNNSLKGSMPNSIAKLSTKMKFLNLGYNQIHGYIPVEIENLVHLVLLALQENNLIGEIPTTIGVLPELQSLVLAGNQLSGKIPDSIGNLTLLSSLELENNNLQGEIPSSLGNCRKLSLLYLHRNRLTGTIPQQAIGLLSIMAYLRLSYNAFTGLLPSEIGNLSSLVKFDISSNKLSGPIPNTLSNCLMLVTLNIANNMFEGKIPESFSVLEGLEELDFSHNKLSGEIPNYLVNFTHLSYLNFSYNELEGPVPMDGIFQNASAILVVGNNKLCGGLSELKLLPCGPETIKKKQKFLTYIVIIPVIVTSVCFLVFGCFLLMCYRRQSSKTELFPPSFKHRLPRISYAELVKATNSFSVNNLVGVGSYGRVYRGFLEQVNTTVAVKVLNLQQEGGSKSFFSECNALKNLRHRNLLKIISACSSLDFQGNDFKALVFEFMPHGSLEEWLYPVRDEQYELKNLSFLQRLNTCIDVASALDYLHHHCKPTIIHCDLKPSNILFDGDMTAHVADFGLARIVSATSYKSSRSQGSSLAFKGSIGYVPPEYGIGGLASMEGDIYSYGILLLEAFTAKRPTDDMFQDGQSLHTFAKTTLPEQVMHIVDARMPLEGREDDINISKKNDRPSRPIECLLSIIRIGVACSVESSRARMNIAEVLPKLYQIRNYHEGVTDYLE